MIDLKLNKRILLVEVENKKMMKCWVNDNNQLVYLKKWGAYIEMIEKLPKGFWSQPIKANEVTEEIAKEIVEVVAHRGGEFNPLVGHYQSSGWHKGFKNYENVLWLTSAVSSFQSLLTLNSLSPDKTILIIEK